jgi:hypothetical protein
MDTKEASPEQLAKAKAVFESLLRKMKKDFRAERTRYYREVENRVRAGFDPENFVNYPTVLAKLKALYPGFYDWPHMRVAELFIPTGGGDKSACYRPCSPEQAAKIIREEIKTDERKMFWSFIEKQTRKVAGIIKDRGIKVTGEVTKRTLECKLHFDLSDGSKFDMVCQIVDKVSSRGTPFWQFPTTFHQVFKADGTQIATPSEAKLKREL